MFVPPHKNPITLVQTNRSDTICSWLHYWETPRIIPRSNREALARELASYRINSEPLDQNSPNGAGVCVCSEPTPEFCDFVRIASRAGRERIIAVAGVGGLVNGVCHWDLLQAG